MPAVNIPLWGGRHIEIVPAGWLLIALAALFVIALVLFATAPLVAKGRREH